MISFLFWNLNKKNLSKVIEKLAHEYDIDVLLFTECIIPPDIILSELNREMAEYHYAPGICTKIQIFTRFPRHYIEPIHEADRITIRHLCLPGLIDILLAVDHFPSKLHWGEDSQAHECTVLADTICRSEKTIGHSRTVLVGDLNMNPFESGIVSAVGLHGVMSRQIAERQKRIVQKREYQFFYNPMWGLLGDSTPGPPGTYYYHQAEHKVYFWNMFDQVLIRPQLLNRFKNSDLTIVHSCGEFSLLSNNGVPDSNIASDHLPVVFKLNL